MKRITIYDVAKEADVSLATVSRVINGSEVVREDTRLKVQEAIEKLGYKPNAIAQGLALQKTTTIAFVIPEASFFYTGQIINGLIDVAKLYNYNMVLHTTTEGISATSDIIETIIKSRVDGVVIFNDKLNNDDIATLTNYDVPIVVIGNRISNNNICSVYVDYEALIYDYASQLYESGIRNMALVEDRKNPAMIEELYKGLKRVYEEHGEVFENYITIPKEYRSSYEYLKEYFNNNTHEFVFTYRDSQAMAVLNVAKEVGIDIPNDMQLVCVLDSKYNVMARPQISGFKIPDYDLGAVSMRIMTKMLQDDEHDSYNRETELSYVFTPRQTTK
ncbi:MULTISPECIES: LacI family DNA-binding transcriptional regulator [Breznakia]|uniref:LacI family transcriptional regulator n=1 Tax=Breznakia blatticola TaxID=1754012 RepID=A0A4R8A4T8_9FIRM|nr:MULTISPECIES: LacI family DNA-binding transcriptional regulator [Breznakia]MDH6366322.1 LacI family transcriptional regulator [Breznakia sp. PH1-1]MDH6403415.1 LacI family transcriptional regulator [Breznakia sp. PF1-11]MDH6411124.1 LacI family transcriptional regulator [Breznakia sp. PFB1-11]MDH6413613.1 LacI family transcriptional regulator [Breznakia sp. PFB1-14]MDH6415669.1 LacI family transcriptional regulator [Breznakia sp. PFB1-4]